jgi:hypothetical protein
VLARVNYGLPHSEARCRTLSIARELDITSPRCAGAHAQDLRFRRHQQPTCKRYGDRNNARGLASDHGCNFTITTRLPLRLRLAGPYDRDFAARTTFLFMDLPRSGARRCALAHSAPLGGSLSHTCRRRPYLHRPRPRRPHRYHSES